MWSDNGVYLSLGWPYVGRNSILALVLELPGRVLPARSEGL